MKKKGRILSGLLAVLMVFSFVACGQEESAAPKQEEQADADVQQEEKQPEDDGGGSGNVLVAYYSATGSTADVAGTIAEALGADLFEIMPAEPYTSEDLDWTNDDSRVTREHEDESLRTVELVSDTVENWDSYDTVFIGYPIWWGIAAWPVNGFVSANDFDGKTVIPFCTSSSSGIGESGELLAALAGSGDWQEGQRFRSGAAAEDVADWAEGWK